MSKKIKWSDIYKDFRMRHPNLKKMVTDWKPHDYLTILLRLNDGSQITYEYMTRDTKFIKR